MSAELNIFLNDGAAHVKLLVPDELASFDEEGNPEMGLPPERVAEILAGLVAALEAKGFKPSAKPSGFAGRKERTETPAPEGMPVPEHCGAPCEFKPPFTNPKTGRQVSAKFQCRSNTCPEKALTGWPWSIFVDAWMKVQHG